MDNERTQFDYLLNAFEQASQAHNPHMEGYAEKRRKLYAYVRDLERRPSPAGAAQVMEQARGALDYIVSRENFAFAECSEAEEIWRRAKEALSALDAHLKEPK